MTNVAFSQHEILVNIFVVKVKKSLQWQLSSVDTLLTNIYHFQAFFYIIIFSGHKWVKNMQLQKVIKYYFLKFVVCFM